MRARMLAQSGTACVLLGGAAAFDVQPVEIRAARLAIAARERKQRRARALPPAEAQFRGRAERDEGLALVQAVFVDDALLGDVHAQLHAAVSGLEHGSRQLGAR